MSKVIEITYSRGQTHQAKQFSPINVHYSAKMEVTDTDNLEEAYQKLETMVDGLVERKIRMFEGTKASQIKAHNQSPF